MNRLRKTIIILIMILLSYCNPTESSKTKDVEGENEINYDLEGWNLVWHDEFEADSLDMTSWRFETGGHGWGNSELQYYTDRTDNTFLEDGKLIIKGIKEDYKGSEYTSARVNSVHGWCYKRIDISAKLPMGIGTWPALWMLPDDWNLGNGSWPDNGELDIMEHVGHNPGHVSASIHCHAYNHKNNTHKTGSMFLQTAMTEFHVYSIQWEQSQINYFVDDSLIFTYEKTDDSWEKWPFFKDFHLIFNIAIGGSWGGAQGVDDLIFPVFMEIDYVRVYEKEEE